MRFFSHAPVRTADLGGWSDTWFAGRGVVCNVAVEPGIRVEITPDAFPGRGALTLELSDGQCWIGPLHDPPHDVDPLLWTTIQSVPCRSLRESRVRIHSSVPSGSGLGTSAAVVVALLAALDAVNAYELGVDISTVDRVETIALARRAHAVETELGRQSGVQDHCAAAFGGVRRYRFSYPEIEDVTPPIFGADELNARLVTVYLGYPHESSQVHERVIKHLESIQLMESDALLNPLREAAEAGYEALLCGDLDAYGHALLRNHEAQDRLGPGLISEEARALFDSVRDFRARGWKTNGAGGDGGSIAVLGPADQRQHDEMVRSLRSNPAWKVLDLSVATSGVVRGLVEAAVDQQEPQAAIE